MERRSCSPIMVTILLALACLSVWQMIGCPGPPNVYVTNPVYTILNPSNYTLEPSFSIDSLPPWDFTTLINLDDFKFKTINFVCNETAPFLLILVHSAPGNVNKRKTIRETWGEVRDNVRLLFMLGEVDEINQRNIDLENESYNDIIQGNFIDAYRNLTYKHVMAFKYAVYYCSQVKYVMKTDDDIFVNIFAALTYLNTELSSWGSRRLILCTPFQYPIVKRSYRSKWRVSYKEYSHKYYPPYCPGWAIIYSPDVVFRLYREAQRSDYFWIDDVHITGILAKRIELSHKPVSDLVLTPSQVRNILYYNNTEFSPEFFLYGCPDLKQEVIYNLWFLVKEKMRRANLAR